MTVITASSVVLGQNVQASVSVGASIDVTVSVTVTSSRNPRRPLKVSCTLVAVVSVSVTEYVFH